MMRRLRLVLVAYWRSPPRVHMAALAGVGAGLAAIAMGFPVSRIREVWTEGIWNPIVFDEGFNALNTALLAILFVIGLGWYSSLFRKYQQPVDFRFAAVGIVYGFALIPWRVFEDADLFAPFSEDVQAVGLTANVSCAPELVGSWLTNCLDVFFITPTIWIVAAFGTFFLFLVGWEAQRVVSTLGIGRGAAFLGLSLAVPALLYGALQDLEGPPIRLLPPPIVIALGILAAAMYGGLVLRRGRFTWHHFLIMHAILPIAANAYYLVAWYGMETPSWSYRGTGHPETPLVVLAYVMVLAGSLWLLRWNRFRDPPRRAVTMAAAAALGSALLYIFFARAVEGHGDGVWLATLVGAGVLSNGWLLGRTLSAGLGPMLRVGDPVNWLLLFSQVSDGIATGLGVDVLGAAEKHVVPNAVAAWAATLPGWLGSYPMGLTLLPLKVTGTILLVATLDGLVAPRFPRAHTAAYLTKLGLCTVGLAPAIRNVLRVSMGV